MSQNPAKEAGAQPPARRRAGARLHPGRVEAISAELSPMLPPAADVRRRDRAAARGVAGARAPRRGSPRAGAHVRRTLSRARSWSWARRPVPVAKCRCPAGARGARWIPPRLDAPLLFPARGGGLLNLDNWRRRIWGPAIEASGVQKPARIYDLRSTFASDALAAGVSVFELARIMGTSMAMIERHYGTLIEALARHCAQARPVRRRTSGVVVAPDRE